MKVAAPKNVGCNTVLTNGNMLGQYINQGRARDYGQIDFKKRCCGKQCSCEPCSLGQAGNFAYYAIGSGYISPDLLRMQYLRNSSDGWLTSKIWVPHLRERFHRR